MPKKKKFTFEYMKMDGNAFFLVLVLQGGA